MTSVFSSSTHIWMYALIFVVSSRRNKTNPQHGNKFIPVINATHVQAFKPKLSTHDQSWRTDQQMLDNIYVCVSWNIFNRIHFFAIRDALFQRFARFHATSIWSFRQLTKQLRRTIFLIINKNITLLDDCINTTALAKQSLHHNIILEKQDHSSVGRISAENVLPGSHTRSLLHITRVMRKQKCLLPLHTTAIFFSFFPSSRTTMKMTKSFCWLVVDHPAISFLQLSPRPDNDEDDKIVLLVGCRSSSYFISSTLASSGQRWRWQNRFAGWLSIIQLFHFFNSRLVVDHPAISFLQLSPRPDNDEDDKIVLLVGCRSSSYFISSTLASSGQRWRWQNRFAGWLSIIQLFHFFNSRLVRTTMKMTKSFCWLVVDHPAISFLQLSPRPDNDEDDKIVLLVGCRSSSYFISSTLASSGQRWRWQNRFAGWLSIIQLFHFFNSRLVRTTMKMTKSFCWLVVDHPAISFLQLSPRPDNDEDDKIVLLVGCRSSSYFISSTLASSGQRWRWQNRFAGWLSIIQLFHFFNSRLVRTTMKMTKSFCWLVVDHPAISFLQLSPRPDNDEDDKIVLLVGCRSSSYFICVAAICRQWGSATCFIDMLWWAEVFLYRTMKQKFTLEK